MISILINISLRIFAEFDENRLGLIELKLIKMGHCYKLEAMN